MTHKTLLLFIIFFFTYIFQEVTAQPKLSFKLIIDGYDAPLGVVSAQDGSGRLFILGKNGLISIYQNGSVKERPFLNITGKVSNSGEAGMGGMVFHPDYEHNGYFYVFYNNLDGNITLTRWKVSATDPDSADVNSEVILFSQEKKGGYTNHNGGDLHFGKDGYLYVSTGDGGSPGDSYNNAQNGKSLFGKILRLNVDDIDTPPYYSIPPDNPFINNPDYLPEVFALGLRNPWRWSFDKETGDMWLADVGQDSIEEVNFRTPQEMAGSNYGWHCYEGNHIYSTDGCGNISNSIFPVVQFKHDVPEGGNSIIGGFVYRGSLYPQLAGYYICADFIFPHAWLIRQSGNGSFMVALQSEDVPEYISSIGEDDQGELYATSINGQVYQIQAEAVDHAILNSFSADPYQQTVKLTWETLDEVNVYLFEIEKSDDGLDFTGIGQVNPMNNQSANTYAFEDKPKNSGQIYYRLVMHNTDGTTFYSAIEPVLYKPEDPVFIYPTILSNRNLNIQLNDAFDAMMIFDFAGRKVFEKNLTGITGSLAIQLPSVATGVYLVSFSGKRPLVKKIMIHF